MRVRTNKSEPGTRFYIIKRHYYDTKGRSKIPVLLKNLAANRKSVKKRS